MNKLHNPISYAIFEIIISDFNIQLVDKLDFQLEDHIKNLSRNNLLPSRLSGEIYIQLMLN